MLMQVRGKDMEKKTKRIIFCILIVMFIMGFFYTSPDEKYIQAIKWKEHFLASSPEEPLKFRWPTQEEMKCPSMRNLDDSVYHSTPTICYSWDYHFFVDQFGGNHKVNPRNWTQKGLEELNRHEQDFFKEHGETAKHYGLRTELEFLYEHLWNDILIKWLKFILCYCIIVFLCWGMVFLYKKFHLKIKSFIKSMNTSKYLLILASVATLALLCIAIKICL